MSVDDTTVGVIEKLSKVMRYTRLYGASRTLVKVKGQYHMKRNKEYYDDKWENVACNAPNDPMRCVAIIGCGYYSYSVIAFYLKSINARFLRGVLDIQRARSRSLCFDYGGAYATNELQTILDDSQVKIVFIASNHASHADYAVKCILAGKHVHIEKPHVVSMRQLDLLTSAQKVMPNVKIFIGFNRPRSYLFACLKGVLERHEGPLMINWFIVGHYLQADHWYYDVKEGGRILGNLSHWSDLTLQIVGIKNIFPCEIIPATIPGSKSDYVVVSKFGDGSIGVITFSAKGKTSSGVSEVLNLQKGDCMANLNNFELLTVDEGNRKKIYKQYYRDHGHRLNIKNSYINAVSCDGRGESLEYIRATARFILAIQDAIESGSKVMLEAE